MSLLVAGAPKADSSSHPGSCPANSDQATLLQSVVKVDAMKEALDTTQKHQENLDNTGSEDSKERNQNQDDQAVYENNSNEVEENDNKEVDERVKEGEDGQDEDAVRKMRIKKTSHAHTANILHNFNAANTNKCNTPPSIPLMRPEGQELLDALSSPPRIMNSPFLWLHYGDGDMMTMSGMSSSSIEGADMTSDCVRKGVADMFLGEHADMETSRTHVYEALGAFFMCKENHGAIYDKMENFAHRHPEHKFGWHNDFYLPVGEATATPQHSFVVAAKQGGRPVVLVGPKHLDSLHCMLNHSAYFEIPLPTKGCGDVDRLSPQLVQYSKSKFPNDSVLFVVAGGSIGKMIAYEAFKSLKDKDAFVDVGASLDAYAGHSSRDYNRNLQDNCAHSKEWMAYDVCKSHCNDSHEGKCQKLGPDKKCRDA